MAMLLMNDYLVLSKSDWSLAKGSAQKQTLGMG